MLGSDFRVTTDTIRTDIIDRTMATITGRTTGIADIGTIAIIIAITIGISLTGIATPGLARI